MTTSKFNFSQSGGFMSTIVVVRFMKSTICSAVIGVCLLSAIDSASAQVHVGFGGGLPRDSTFGNGMIALYGDYIRPSAKPVTWLAGGEWTYALTGSDDPALTDLTYTSFNVHGGVLWYLFARGSKLGHLYTSAGPSVLHYTINSNNVTGIFEFPCGGTLCLGGNSQTVASLSKTAIGGYTAIGYQGTFWHMEMEYGSARTDLIKPGGLIFKFGFSSRSSRDQ